MVKYTLTPEANMPKGEVMQMPEDVEAMLALQRLGWGSKKIAKELRVSRKTVRKYLAAGGWSPYGQPCRPSQLEDHGDWIKEQFLRHRGNAEVVRQELSREKKLQVSLRTVERFVQPFRRELQAGAKATVRFETPPGKQMQIDFGSMRMAIGPERPKVFLFVATLGFSRRNYVAPFQHERQEAWFKGIEGAFERFDGVPEELLIDNPRGLVTYHNPQTREVRFSPRFLQFASYWGFRPKACLPYRARTKGKDERAVSYVKHNAIAGREFISWDALERHLDYWMTEVSDCRIHGTTGTAPIERFEEEALRPLTGRPPFLQIQEVERIVHTDACVELETNSYSVPWHLIGSQVRVQVIEDQVLIFHNGSQVAVHAHTKERRKRIIERGHLKGIIGSAVLRPGELQRPLSEYEALIGGGW